MEIDIFIDAFTHCLIDNKTGIEEKTYYKICDKKIPRAKNGWKFDWNKQQRDSKSVIYELFTEKDDELQGRISFRLEDGFIFVELVETAPHNYGSKGKYSGVGAHLFAIACKESFSNGFEGNVSFVAKTRLIEHYQKTLGAVLISSQVMIINQSAAYKLVQNYFKDEV